MKIRKENKINSNITATVCKAVHDLAAALGAKVIVVKQSRCSDQWSETADALSKNDQERVKAEMGSSLEKRKRRIPRELSKFLENPIPDMELGTKVATEISQKIPGMLIWEKVRMSLEERTVCRKMNKEMEEQEEERKELVRAIKRKRASKGGETKKNRRRGKKRKM